MDATITEQQLRQHLGATPKELASLRLLLGTDGDGWPRDLAAMALQRLRQGRRPAAASALRSAPAELLRKLRGANRRVPLEVRREG